MKPARLLRGFVAIGIGLLGLCSWQGVAGAANIRVQTGTSGTLVFQFQSADQAQATGFGLIQRDGSGQASYVELLDTRNTAGWSPGTVFFRKRVIGGETFELYVESNKTDSVAISTLHRTYSSDPARNQTVDPNVPEHIQQPQQTGAASWALHWETGNGSFGDDAQFEYGDLAIALNVTPLCDNDSTPCQDPNVVVSNHNSSRIDYRQEPVQTVSTALTRIDLPDASAGEARMAPDTGTSFGSRIDNLRWSYVQESVDFATGPHGPNGDARRGVGKSPWPGDFPSLQVKRFHRPRLEHLLSSFGPGVFSNFDAKLTFYRQGLDNQPNAVLFDPETDAPPLTFFELSAGDDDNAVDGIYHDRDTRAYRRLLLFNGSTRVSDPFRATSAQVEKHDGGVIVFEVVSAHSGAPDEIDGRPISYADRNGNKLTVRYQFPANATDQQLGHDRTQLWKISVLADDHAHSVQVAYVRRSTTNRWAIATVTATVAGGSSRVYAYKYFDSGPGLDTLMEVVYPNGDTSQFAKFLDSGTQTLAFLYDDVAGGSSRFLQTVFVTNSVFQTPDGVLHNQPPNLVRRVVNGGDEEVFRNQEDPNDPAITYVKDAGRRLSRITTDSRGAPVEVARARSVTSDPLAATYDSFERYVPNQAGMITQVIDAAGKTRSFARDALTRALTGLTARDGTTAAWTLNSFQEPTHLVDRLGRVTNATYDSKGNMLAVTYAPGTAIQASWRYAYAVSGQVLTMTDARNQVTSYAYDPASKYLGSITEPPDITGGTRAVTKFGYDEFGLLTTMTDASGRRITYGYDARNRLTTTKYPDGTTETIVYGTGDLAGEVQSRKDRNGNVDTYQYDTTRRLQKTIRASNRPERIEEIYEYVPGLELTSAVTTAGGRTEYAYDQRNREITRRQFTTNSNMLVTQRQYDTSDRQTSVRDPYGRNAFFVYDSTDRAIRVIRELVPGGVPSGSDLGTLARITTANPSFVIEDTAYDGMNQTVSSTNGRGITIGITYDVRGRRTQTVDAAGTPNTRIHQYEYDLADNLTRETRPRTFREGRSFLTTYSYTGRNLLASRTEASGAPEAATTSHTYTPTRRIAATTDPRGGTVMATYDTCCDRLSTTRDQLGFVIKYGYDGVGNQTSVTDALALVAKSTYDGHNRELTRTNPAGEATKYQYDDDLTDGLGLDAAFASSIEPLGFGANAKGSAILTTDPAGGSTLVVFDEAGRQLLTVDPNGNATRVAYDAVVGGLVETTTTDALGNATKVRTDGAGRRRVSVDAAGKATNQGFDPAGNVVFLRDPNVTGKDCSFDQLNQETSCTDTQGDTQGFEYDAAGNATASVDGTGVRTTSVYDTRDRKVASKDGVGGTSTFAYDGNGNLTSITDAQGGATKYGYDARNLKTSATFPDSSNDKKTFAYDGDRRLIKVTDQSGNVKSAAYDAASRLTKTSYPDAKNDTFVYDKASRMTSATSARYGTVVAFAYDKGGRETQERLTFQSKTYDVLPSYDAGNRPTQLQYPDGARVIRTFTNRNELASLSFGTRSIASYTYDEGGRLASTTFGNGLVEGRGYRPDNRLSGISTPGIGDLGYTYDKAKRKLSAGGPAAAGGAQVFNYDADGRPTKWTRGSSVQSWKLSLEGDWTSTTIGNTTQNRTHNPGHELTAVGSTPLTYDARGNMTNDDESHALTWDFNNLLQRAVVDNGSAATASTMATANPSTTVTYAYDALGRKVAKTVGNSTTVFVSAGSDVIAEYVNGTLSLKYVLGLAADHYVALINAGKIYWYTRDHVGTVQALTDEQSSVKELYQYAAFGERDTLAPDGTHRNTSAVGNRIGFTGRFHDRDTQLMDFRFRQYHPRLGRFISRDDGYHEGFNLYMAYFVPNSFDPTGHVGSQYASRLSRSIWPGSAYRNGLDLHRIDHFSNLTSSTGRGPWDWMASMGGLRASSCRDVERLFGRDVGCTGLFLDAGKAGSNKGRITGPLGPDLSQEVLGVFFKGSPKPLRDPTVPLSRRNRPRDPYGIIDFGLVPPQPSRGDPPVGGSDDPVIGPKPPMCLPDKKEDSKPLEACDCGCKCLEGQATCDSNVHKVEYESKEYKDKEEARLVQEFGKCSDAAFLCDSKCPPGEKIDPSKAPPSLPCSKTRKSTP